MHNLLIWNNGIKVPVKASDVDVGGTTIGELLKKVGELERKNSELTEKCQKLESAVKTVAQDLDNTKKVVIEEAM